MNTFLIALGYILVCWLACLLIRPKSGVSYNTNNGKFNVDIHPILLAPSLILFVISALPLMLRAKKLSEISENKPALEGKEGVEWQNLQK